MSKRGLSVEEKKTKMLEIFHDTSEFYTMKELEKLGPKLKGVVQQTVKEIVDDLVSDDLVCFDKIGTSNYYWSFPSTAGATKQAALSKVQQELQSVNAKIEETSEALEKAESGREDTAERRKLLVALSAVQAESTALKDELAAFGAADPIRYERKKAATQVCKDAAYRWTDNTMILLGFATTLGAEEDQMRAMLGMSEDWDDLK
ncbi:meiotic nuclear division protein 1 [Naematelia encephala]|uniref:Meiotic nuclear division protein 1 n=1 Tax=Naematelia encephala TaxID=71784 RepID=A0A1Y2AJE2_9TREE|nr:meiotic nuclear division protein 1 [Naematelia encephala]